MELPGQGLEELVGAAGRPGHPLDGGAGPLNPSGGAVLMAKPYSCPFSRDNPHGGYGRSRFPRVWDARALTTQDVQWRPRQDSNLRRTV